MSINSRSPDHKHKTVCVKDGTFHPKSVCKRGWRGELCLDCSQLGGKKGLGVEKLWPAMAKYFS